MGNLFCPEPAPESFLGSAREALQDLFLYEEVFYANLSRTERESFFCNYAVATQAFKRMTYRRKFTYLWQHPSRVFTRDTPTMACCNFLICYYRFKYNWISMCQCTTLCPSNFRCIVVATLADLVDVVYSNPFKVRKTLREFYLSYMATYPTTLIFLLSSF